MSVKIADTIEVSVIMGIYAKNGNRCGEKRIRELENQLIIAVDSVMNQTFRNFELIICDDGSGKEMKEFLYRLYGKNPRIRLISEPVNRGLAYALNQGIRAASGRYIARMDADDISAADRLSRQYRYLEQNPEISFVGCCADLIDETGVWGKRMMAPEPKEEDYLKYSPFIHPSVMFRTEVFKMAGGYLVSEETRRCEDYELFLRLFLKGIRGQNMPEVLFQYREDKKCYKKRIFQDRIREMNLRKMYFKKLKVPWRRRVPAVLRPIAAGLVPAGVIRFVRRIMEGL